MASAGASRRAARRRVLSPAGRRPGVRALAGRAVLVLGGLALAAGCVPASGAVRPVQPVAAQGPLAGQGIRVLAQPPRPDASPETLTRQFLLASADPDDDFATARSFLVPDQRASWNPRAGVTIYDGDPSDLQVVRAGSEVSVTAPATLATIHSGDYRLSQGALSTSLTVRVQKVDGQYRLRDVPDGLLLPASMLFAFKPVDLYFLDPGLHRLVPDRVFLLASRGGLAAAAIEGLLAGPSPQLAGAVRSAIPAGTTLAAPPSLRGGVLNVQLHTPAGRLNRAAIAAQVLWTADQLPEITGVRLTIDGAAYLSGTDSVLNADPDALAYDPDGLPAPAPGYYLVRSGGHSVLRDTDGGQWTLTGRGATLLRHPGVSLDRASVAALACAGGGCHSLYLGPVGTAPLSHGLTAAGTLTPPSWDFAGSGAWTVENRPGAPPRLWIVPLLGRAHSVGVPGFGSGTVRAMRLSRDGTRIAAVVDSGHSSSVLVGVVRRSGSGSGTVRIGGFRSAAPGLVGVVDVAWSDADHLAVLGKLANDGSVTPYRVRVDGSEAPQPVLGTAPPGQPVSLAAGPGQPLLVATQQGQGEPRVSQLVNSTWTPPNDGNDPVYPG